MVHLVDVMARAWPRSWYLEKYQNAKVRQTS